jgi:hypothetical protein
VSLLLLFHSYNLFPPPPPPPPPPPQPIPVLPINVFIPGGGGPRDDYHGFEEADDDDDDDDDEDVGDKTLVSGVSPGEVSRLREWLRKKAEERYPEPSNQIPSYHFDSSLDQDVRWKIAKVLEQADKRGWKIERSRAWKTLEKLDIQGHFIKTGQNVWALKLPIDMRLDISKLALKGGFRLVTFDDGHLLFVPKSKSASWSPFVTQTTKAAIGIGFAYFLKRFLDQMLDP